MPERKAGRRVPTPDTQGPDSWILLRPMTVGEVIGLQKERERTLTEERWWQRLLNRLKKQKAKPQSEIYRAFTRRVIGYVADWNWVDDTGQPLPNPRECPEVVESLTDTELNELLGIIYGGGETEDVKN